MPINVVHKTCHKIAEATDTDTIADTAKDVGKRYRYVATADAADT